MSIVEAIDAETKSIEKEIEELEAQLQPRRTRLEALGTLREQAEALPKSEGGGH